MLRRSLTLRARFARVILAALVGFAPASWAAPADDLREAQKLYGQGKLQPALDKIEVFLKAQPKDAQGRFLKGLVLTEQKRTNEAIQVFTGLTEDYPELPEPYNNLAVLYASQGNYDKAKAALELAIHTHPSYATAHENLGDIYAQLASRAYDRALQLDKSNTAAKVKLSMVKDLFGNSQRVAQSGAKPDAAKAETAPRKEAKEAPAKPAAPKAAESKAAPKAPEAKAPENRPAPAPKAPPVAVAAPSAPNAAAPPAAASDDGAQVAAAVESWAKAWSAKDVKGYLAHYAPDFEVPGGENRASWENQRAERIQRPKSIQVDVKIQSVKVSGNEATAVFRQSYRSDTLKSSTTKTLRLVKSGGRWLIRQERAGG